MKINASPRNEKSDRIAASLIWGKQGQHEPWQGRLPSKRSRGFHVYAYHKLALVLLPPINPDACTKIQPGMPESSESYEDDPVNR